MQTPQECFGIPGRKNPSRSELVLNKATAYGSSNTKVRLFGTQLSYSGSDIVYVNDAAFGTIATILTDGLYFVSYTDQTTSSDCTVGVIQNGTAGATSINGITYAQGYRGSCDVSSNGIPITHSVVLYCRPGDKLWCQSNTGNNSNNSEYTVFRIVKISN